MHYNKLAYGAWAAYWDETNGAAEIDAAGGALTDVIAFAAIFGANGEPFLLPEAARLTQTLTILYGATHTVYLSVVNDVETAEEQYENKSTSILWRVLGTDEAVDAHIDALMNVLSESGAEGLEIDYEAIRTDTALWQRYVYFLTKLYARTSAEGVPLRAVLEWNAAQYATFPKGPQYSVMCYNLYGSHSGPGPKADRAFLKNTFLLCRSLPGDTAMAFATGGYDWGADGSVSARTQIEAEKIIDSYGVAAEDVQRDADSGALYFCVPEAGRRDARGLVCRRGDAFRLARAGGDGGLPADRSVPPAGEYAGVSRRVLRRGLTREKQNKKPPAARSHGRRLFRFVR